jgi:uncharacterized repeat protein (TIGR02543 family)
VNNSTYGSVSVSPDQASYDHGTEVTIIALPAEGYKFDDWTGSSETNDTIVVTMNSDLTLTANFSSTTPETMSFQDGVSPDASYDGTSDVQIAGEWGWQQTKNHEGSNLNFDDFTSSLIKWDISSLPSNIEVSAAEITFFNYTVSSDEYEIYEVTKDWVASQTTWNIAKTGSDWETPGAKGSTDHGSTVLGTINMSNSWATQTYSLNSNGVALIQDWVDGTKTNNGFIIQDYTNTSRGQFVNEGDSDVNRRPKLTVTYTLKSAKARRTFSGNSLSSIRMYPNPSNAGQALNIELIGFEDETNATINIMDISGRIAYSTNVNTKDMVTVEQSINPGNLSAGMYMVVVRSSNKVINQRLIVR